MALNQEDIRVLEFLAEHRVVIGSQVSALLGCDPGRVSRRLRGLADAGLLTRERIFDGYPAACRITSRGLACIHSTLPPPRLDLKGYRHDVGVAWLWLAARRGAFGRLEGVVSEREMRSSDRRRSRLATSPLAGPTDAGAGSGRYGIGVGAAGARGGLALHYPDLVIQTATGHRAAIELELTAKGPRRLDRIMLGYAGDPAIDAVLYVCQTRAIGLGVQAAARRAGISDLVQVQLLAPGSPAGAPELGRSTGRAWRSAERSRGGDAVRAAGQTRSGVEL